MTKSADKRYVIFDTDMGTDDAWALLMLLKAEKCLKNIEILAVTCVFGNTSLDNVIKNTYHILHSKDRSDVRLKYCELIKYSELKCLITFENIYSNL